VIAAAALKCMGGSIQGRLWAKNEQEAEAIRASGRDLTKILYTEDLVKGNDVSGDLAVLDVFVIFLGLREQGFRENC
jgi:fructose-1,6-bisphosphatase/sedoheptulose 1,7-bisphosphatase-like protein